MEEQVSLKEEKASPVFLDKALSLLSAARPRQWTKNLIIFGPVIFAAKLSDMPAVFAAFLCVIAFCMTSSAIYLFNDVLDREQDRIHPRKSKRAIASGKISVALALTTALFLVVGGFAIAMTIRPSVALFVLVYTAIMLTYGLYLKHIVLIDVMTVASGFVIRAVAGGLAAVAPASGWFLLCASFGSLFLALEKRRHELSTLSQSANQHRAVLDHYSTELIDRVQGIVVPGLLTCYIFYSFQSYHGQWMMLTVPFVFYGIVRYQILSIQEVLTGTPEEVLLRDRPTQVTILLWLLTSIGVLYRIIPDGAQHIISWLDSISIMH
jgi:4-hydroxybenzoate polyprenyltransferase